MTRKQKSRKVAAAAETVKIAEAYHDLLQRGADGADVSMDMDECMDAVEEMGPDSQTEALVLTVLARTLFRHGILAAMGGHNADQLLNEALRYQDRVISYLEKETGFVVGKAPWEKRTIN